MVGISRAVVTALFAAATAVALPRGGGNGRGNNNGNGNMNGGGNSNALPIVDLGYSMHEAVSGNVSDSIQFTGSETMEQNYI